MSERRSPLEPPGTPRRHWRDSVTRLSLLGMVTFQVWVTVEERVVDAAGATGLVILALTGAAAFVVARRSAARDGVHPLPDTGWIVATLLICLMSGWIRGLETSLASRCYILAFSLLGAVLVPWWACRRRDLPAAVMGCLAIVSAGPFQLESLRSYALVAQLAWLAILVAPRSSAGGRQGRWIAVVFLPFLITIATSTVFSVFPYASSKALVQIVIGMGVAVAASSIMEDEAGRFRLAIVVSLTGAGMGLAAVVRLVYRIAILGYGTGIGFRVWPMDTPPNYASFHMLAVIPLSLLILVPRARGWKRVLAAIPAAFMALYVIISYARISWAGLFVEAVVIALLLFGRRVVKGILSPRRVLLAAVILVLAWSAAPGSFKQRFVEGFQPGREPRFDVWRDVAAIVRDYPWLGTGLDTKRYVLPQYQAERRPFEPVTGQYLLDAHSTYVELASAAGLPALAAFVWLLFSAAAGARMLARRQRTLAVAALAALTAVSLDGFFNFRLLLPVNAYLFWMVVGIGLMQGPAILERCRPRRLVTATGLLVMLAAVLFAHLERANRALIYRGLHIIQSGADHVNGKRALGRFLTARALMPMDAHSAYLVGVWHENFGNSDEALRWYRKTLERNPSSALYCDTTGALLMAAGEYEAAEPLLRRANELEPYRQGGVYRRRLATLYLATGRLDEALAQLTTATLIAPDTVNALAEILNGRGGTPWNEVLCARAATVALDLHLDHPALSELLYRRTATAYEAAGLPARSLDMYRHMYKFFGRYTVMHLPLSRLFWRMDRRELALAVLQVRIYQAPRDGVVYNELGVRRFQMGEMEEAEAAFRAALRHWPSIVMDNHLAYQYLVLIARQRGNREMERKALRRLRFVTGGLDHQLWEFKYHFADMFGEVGQYQAYKVAISP